MGALKRHATRRTSCAIVRSVISVTNGTPSTAASVTTPGPGLPMTHVAEPTYSMSVAGGMKPSTSTGQRVHSGELLVMCPSIRFCSARFLPTSIT